MKNKKKQALRLLFIAFLILPTLLISQDKEAFKPTFKWNVTGQIWARYSDLNEGSLIYNEPTTN